MDENILHNQIIVSMFLVTQGCSLTIVLFCTVQIIKKERIKFCNEFGSSLINYVKKITRILNEFI